MTQIPSPKIIRSKRKTLALTVTPDATLVVKAPQLMPMLFINSFIKKNENWIQQQLTKVKQSSVEERKYRSGEQFLFLGMNLTLELGNYSAVSVSENKLLFPEALQFRAQKQLTNWYKKQAREIITKQVEYYSTIMQTKYTNISFADTKSQWGRCTQDNRLQFNWRLVMAPILTINYVVVHELAHTIEKNHSEAFWNIVQKYHQSYKRQRKWLKDKGHTLVF